MCQHGENSCGSYMAKIKAFDDTQCKWRREEFGTLICCGRGMNWYNNFGGQVDNVYASFKCPLTINSASRIYPADTCVYKDVHCMFYSLASGLLGQCWMAVKKQVRMPTSVRGLVSLPSMWASLCSYSNHQMTDFRAMKEISTASQSVNQREGPYR